MQVVPCIFIFIFVFYIGIIIVSGTNVFSGKHQTQSLCLLFAKPWAWIEKLYFLKLACKVHVVNMRFACNLHMNLKKKIRNKIKKQKPR